MCMTILLANAKLNLIKLQLWKLYSHHKICWKRVYSSNRFIKTSFNTETNNLTLCPESKLVEVSIYTDYFKNKKLLNNKPVKNVYWSDWPEKFFHWKNLKMCFFFYGNYKVQRGIRFKRKPWLKIFLDKKTEEKAKINTESRGFF